MPAPKSAPQYAPFVDSLKLPGVVRPEKQCHTEVGKLTVNMLNVKQQLHSAFLAPTELWAYDKTYPGPSVEVRRGERVQVQWRNALEGKIPVTAVIADDPGPTDPIPENEPGLNGKTALADNFTAELKAWTVVHLHGARVDADSDGWTENALLPGSSKLVEYDNDQRATQLWYHDHGMDITRFNVYSGLAGFWFIRDHFDDQLIQSLRVTRPDPDEVVPPHKITSGVELSRVVEIPLLIQDRNFDTEDHTPTSRINGRLIHKVEDSTREFFGPYTLVNGVVWPRADVSALPYRLRILNGSNSRVYRLRLLDEQGTAVPFQVIGTDGGLLDVPVTSNGNDLVIAPAERADIVINFAAYAGRKLTWVNAAPAPYKGPSVTVDPANPDLDSRPNVNVMQFSVGPTVHKAKSWTPPQPLSDYKKLEHNSIPHEHQDNLITLIEEHPMVYLCEMGRKDAPREAPSYAGSETDVAFDGGHPPTQTLTTWLIYSKRFRDSVDRVVHYDPGKLADDPAAYYEVWRILNLTVDSHPVHVHLINFQIISRERYISTDADENDVRPVTYGGPVPLEWQDIGWKDTVRVNPNEMVTVLLRFDGLTGRYMYHCHLLDHEDNQMMRPYVVAWKVVTGGMSMM